MWFGKIFILLFGVLIVMRLVWWLYLILFGVIIWIVNCVIVLFY